jgi:hypothetical protein
MDNSYPFPTQPPASYADACFPFACTDSGDVIAWSPTRLPHRRITGRTGSGRTKFARNFVRSVLRAGWRVVALAKHDEYGDFAEHPDVTVATEPSQYAAVIHALSEELRERTPAPDGDHTPVLIVVDEFDQVADGVRRQLKSHDSAQTYRSFHTELSSLLRLGRQYRMHVVAVMGRRSADFGEALDNTFPIDTTSPIAGRVRPLMGPQSSAN